MGGLSVNTSILASALTKGMLIPSQPPRLACGIRGGMLLSVVSLLIVRRYRFNVQRGGSIGHLRGYVVVYKYRCMKIVLDRDQ